MNVKNLEFIKTRKIWYTISLIIIGLGIISLFVQGLNWGIDFSGGSIIEIKVASMSSDDMKSVLAGFNLDKASSIVETTDPQGLMIRTKEIQQEEVQKIFDTVKAQHADAELMRNEQVGPTIGKDLRTKALMAILFACIAIMLYITFRFQFDFGIAAVISLLHDSLIMIAFFSIFQWEVNTQFVAAILTVLGYSINDTIVVFDRIRENIKVKKKMPFGEMCNVSIIETLPRTINTVLTVLLTIVAMLLFGGATIKLFMLALFIGVACGTYSSICIGTPLLITLGKKANNNSVKA